MIARVTIIMSKSKAWWNFLGKFIMKAEGTPYSHFAIVKHEELDSPVFEAVWPKSKKSWYSDWIKKHEVVKSVTLDVMSAERVDVHLWLHEQMNKPYSLFQLVFIYLDLTNKTFKRMFRVQEINGQKELICTELTGLFLEKFFNVNFTESEDMWSLLDIEQQLIEIEKKQGK